MQSALLNLIHIRKPGNHSAQCFIIIKHITCRKPCEVTHKCCHSHSWKCSNPGFFCFKCIRSPSLKRNVVIGNKFCHIIWCHSASLKSFNCSHKFKRTKRNFFSYCMFVKQPMLFSRCFRVRKPQHVFVSPFVIRPFTYNTSLVFNHLHLKCFCSFGFIPVGNCFTYCTAPTPHLVEIRHKHKHMRCGPTYPWYHLFCIIFCGLVVSGKCNCKYKDCAIVFNSTTFFRDLRCKFYCAERITFHLSFN